MNTAMKIKGCDRRQKLFKKAGEAVVPLWELQVLVRANRGREHAVGRSRIWETLLLKTLVEELRNRRLRVGVQKGHIL